MSSGRYVCRAQSLLFAVGTAEFSLREESSVRSLISRDAPRVPLEEWQPVLGMLHEWRRTLVCATCVPIR
jgi:hypothetical protein